LQVNLKKSNNWKL